MPARVPRTRGPSRFTQADLVRAMRAAKIAGIPIALIRIEPDGAIHIVPGNPQSVAASDPSKEWDAKWGM